MIKECIICGSPVFINGEAELITCEGDHCQRIVEDSIGLHYETGQSFGVDNAVNGCDRTALITFFGDTIIKIENA